LKNNFIILSITLFTILNANQSIQSNEHLDVVDIKNKLGVEIPLELMFKDENNNEVSLGKYFDGNKPVILTLAYYTCPMLCTLVFNGLVNGLAEIDKIPYEDYTLLTISIDPEENSSLALSKKENYMNEYFSSAHKDTWTFLTGDEENITLIADAMGFSYSYDSDIKEYAHPAVVYVMTGGGEISSYLFGIEPNSRDLKYALSEAGTNNITSSFEKLLLYCYDFDPLRGSYSLVASNVMKLGGLLTVIALGSFTAFNWVKEKRRYA
tara:strand:+ start:3878 stop:4675 length:798 start_codon:yes stop_codon:yes gene_type:complete